MKNYKYRIYPNEKQKQMFAQHFGCVRFIYNQALSHKNEVYKTTKQNLSYFDLQNDWLKKQKSENIWLKDVYSQTLQMALRNLDNAYTSFFHKRASFPTFKKKSSRQSCQFPQNIKVLFDQNKVQIPKIGKVKAIFHRRFQGIPRLTTVTLSATGKYHVHICVCEEENIKIQPKTNNIIGLDLGLISFITTSEGQKFDAPKPLKKHLNKLSHLQTLLSKKTKGSNKRKKLRLKIAKLHEKITNIRTDFLHKISNTLARENQTICVETLNVKRMIENTISSHVSRAIADVSWSKFLEFLKYKCCDIRECGQFEPTTKLCNKCGVVGEYLSTSIREWTCVCGVTHDRDINAAINIKNFGLEQPVKPI